MNFWHSDLGKLSGEPDDIYGKRFTDIPDGTTVIAKIVSFKNADGFQNQPVIKVQWQITSDLFKNRMIFQNLHVFSDDPKKRHRSLNILMLLYKLYDFTPATDEAPTDRDLKIFEGNQAGIKIGLFFSPETGKSSNFVSEVHDPVDFVCEVGLETMKSPSDANLKVSALMRNKKINVDFEDDLVDMIPF